MSGLALAICGCTSTQTTAARLQLNDSRLRAAAVSVRVKASDTSSTVSVSSETILSRNGSFTAVVTLENRGASAVSDLPISVGYRVGSRNQYLNGGQGLSYFDNHIPSIAAHGSLTWVDTGSAAKRPLRAETFARVGAQPSVPDLGVFTPPRIAVSRGSTAGARGSSGYRVITADLTNLSSVPQYQLPVYAVITRAGRIVGGSSRFITDLGGGAKAVIRLALPAIDQSQGLSVRVEAPATIFK